MTISSDVLRQLLGGLLSPSQFLIVPGTPTLPIIFLVDENHESDDGISEAIVITHELVNRGHVVAIGIEDVPARIDYSSVPPDPNTFILPLPTQGRLPRRYERAMIERDYRIVGIDSATLVEQISDECKHDATLIAGHPATLERSIHFVRALADEFDAGTILGNAIICCGANHNAQILDVAANDQSARPDWWPKGGFVRLRPQSLGSL